MVSYRQINKPTARKLYDEGEYIYLLPCRVNSFIVFDRNYKGFVQPVMICKDTSDDTENKFDRAVNAYEYYNCNSQMGYYAHYFIKENKEEKVNEVKDNKEACG